MSGFGFFLYDILDRFDRICKNIEGKSEYVGKYEKIKENLKYTLNTNAWDGSWYRRAYTDDGQILGHKDNAECKIDSIAQSWSVISHAGDIDKTKIAMESLEKYLIDKDVRNNKTSYTTI